MTRYQITLFSITGKYKPVSTIVTDNTDTMDSAQIRKKGIERICYNHLWGKEDLLKYGYTKMKVRIYDPEKIKAENEKRYERIKEEKYASGEWKRPRTKTE